MEAEKDFLKAIRLETLIPQNSVTEISLLLQDEVSEEENSSKSLLQVKRRDLLFFDEKARALAVLQIPQCDEEVLKSFLGRIEFNVEVWAIDQLPKDSRMHILVDPVKDLVYSTRIVDSNDPVLLAREVEENGETVNYLTLVWEIELLLHRPRIRIGEPSIVLHSQIVVSPSKNNRYSDEVYLTPFEPLEANVLEPMQHIAGYDDDPPYLALSRLERVVPKPPPTNKNFRIEQSSHRYRVIPAAMARIRYFKPGANTPLSTTVASLDIDMVPFVEVKGILEEVDIRLAHGGTDNLMPGSLPMECYSQDLLSLLYRLYPNPAVIPRLGTPQAASPMPMTNIDVLHVSLKMKILLSEICRPLILMELTTNVDFFQALNPLFGPPSQPIHRANRPTNLSMESTNLRASQTVQANLQPFNNSLTSLGLTISFTAPEKPQPVGKPFTWQVLVVNKSQKPIRLAIIPLPRAHRNASHTQNYAKKHAPKSSTASFHPSERRHTRDGEDVDIAQAVVDENVVYAMQHSGAVPPEADLMALTAELRIGPLGPGQCHEAQIQFIAFEAGAKRVDAIRVVDLVKEAELGPAAMGVITDIRDLPDVLVTDEKRQN